MDKLMRCQYCGLLQDEPSGVKECQRCGGELAYEDALPPGKGGSYLNVQMELDQVSAPVGQTVDRYLLVTLRTPESIPPEQAAPTESGRQVLNLAAVLDVSGSMQGEKLAQTKEALRQALRFLHDGDTFSLASFANIVINVLKPSAVNGALRRTVENILLEMQAGGMTALDAGLELGIKNGLKKKSENNLVLLLSDGQANVGETDVERVGLRAFEARQKRLVVSTLGVGQDYNETLMAEIATQGGGRYYHIRSASEIVTYLTGELGGAADLAAREVSIHLTLPKGAVLVPLSAAYTSEMSGNQAKVSIGDIPRDLEVEIPLRVTMVSSQAGERLSIEGEVRYLSPVGNRLSAALNRVTLRFVEPKSFQMRQGVVAPVVERVVKQMRATHVLQVSRAMAIGSKREQQQADRQRVKLRDYLNLLDEQSSEKIADELEQDLYQIRAASPMAKNVMAQAFKQQRFMRDLDKDK